MKKTAAKTAKPSPKSGFALPVGNHPGNTGGKKGRSGRKTEAFKAFCQNLLSDKDVQQAAREIAKDKNHPAWQGAVNWLAKYGHHELVSNVDVTSNGEPISALIAKAFQK